MIFIDPTPKFTGAVFGPPMETVRKLFLSMLISPDIKDEVSMKTSCFFPQTSILAALTGISHFIKIHQKVKKTLTYDRL